MREHLVWRVDDGAVDWYALADGAYSPLLPDAEGILRSRTFPGLWLDCDALIHGTLERVLQVLEQGTRTAEHEAFVARIRPASR